jgi:hypothetical protein
MTNTYQYLPTWKLVSFQVNVKVVATPNSFHFFERNAIPVEIHEDKDEWQVPFFSIDF